MPSVCFYANCEPAVGAGHLLRSIALAEEAVRLGFETHLLTEFLPQSLDQRLADGSIALEIAVGEVTPSALLRKASEGFDIWVFDSYKMQRSFLSEFACQFKTVMIDDEGGCAVPEARAIVNPNAWATPDLYYFHGQSPTQFLCGPEFVLLRRELRGRKWTPVPERPQTSLLVALGGTDATGIGPVVMRSLHDHFNDQVVIRESLSRMLEPSDFVDALASVDMAVIGCGTTAWEALSLGVPVVGLLVADNQERTATFIRSRGLAEVIDCRKGLLGDQLIKAVEKTLNTSHVESSATMKSSSMIDGRGAERVARTLRWIGEIPT